MEMGNLRLNILIIVLASTGGLRGAGAVEMAVQTLTTSHSTTNVTLDDVDATIKHLIAFRKTTLGTAVDESIIKALTNNASLQESENLTKILQDETESKRPRWHYLLPTTWIKGAWNSRTAWFAAGFAAGYATSAHFGANFASDGILGTVPKIAGTALSSTGRGLSFLGGRELVAIDGPEAQLKTCQATSKVTAETLATMQAEKQALQASFDAVHDQLGAKTAQLATCSADLGTLTKSFASLEKTALVDAQALREEQVNSRLNQCKAARAVYNQCGTAATPESNGWWFLGLDTAANRATGLVSRVVSPLTCAPELEAMNAVCDNVPAQ